MLLVVIILSALIILLTTVLLILIKQNRELRKGNNTIKNKLDLFAGVAHEICTPITLISSPLNELELSADLTNTDKNILINVNRQVRRLHDMVRQLLDLRRLEFEIPNVKWEEVYLNPLIENKLLEFQLAAQSKCILLDSIIPDNTVVIIDKEKLNKILDSLMTNSLKYTNSGSITVRVDIEKRGWSLIITDTGVGIPKGEQINIFQKQYRAKNVANYHNVGSGLGLIITNNIVRQMGGTINFVSEEDKGTTFSIKFPYISHLEIKDHPLYGDINSTGEQANISALKEQGNNTILLAEDDLDTLKYLESNLSKEYNVITTTNGNKALELARDINPDIIISDIIMPGIEGDELCRIIKSNINTCHIPVVLLTAMNARESIVHGLESGANDYILKPFDIILLKARLKNIIKNREMLRGMMLNLDSSKECTSYANEMDKEFLNRIMIILNSEISNSDFTINEFCKRMAMSRTVLYNKLKSLTGQSPNDYIRIIRLNKSKELLQAHKYSITEVADMVGFTDPKYFSVCFKKQFGISPSRML